MSSATSFHCIDIGANLTNKRFRKDLPQVLTAARAANVDAIVLTGSDAASTRASFELTKEHPGFLYSTAGIHPHHASEFSVVETLPLIESLCAQPEVVAVGECGLDFNRDFSPRTDQVGCFVAQLKLAAVNRLPLFLHERDAHEEFLELMRAHRDQVSAGVVHCFTGTLEQVIAYLDLDLHIGITGWLCDERRGKHLKEVVRHIPIERLMIETDAPYLAPRDYPVKITRNEPRYLPHILTAVAQARGESPEALAPALLTTTRHFFGFSR